MGAVCGASPAILGAPPPPMPADSRAELAALKARAEMLSAMIASKKSQLHGQGSPCTEAFMLTRFEEAPIMETRVPESSDTEAPVTDAPASEAAGDGQEAASEAAVSARACPECGKQCFTGNSLRAHLRRQHAPADKRPEVLPCLLCDSVLQLQCLEEHERECHWPAEESFWCHRCLTRFGAAADLFWHVRSLCSLT